MEFKTSIEFPVPPRNKLAAEEYREIAEEVFIHTIDGRKITGQILRYSPDSYDIDVLKTHEQSATRIPLTDIKSLQLVNTRQFVPREDAAADISDSQDIPDAKQEYELLYHDGSNDLGETLGHAIDKMGVHIFISQAFNCYLHQFVPYTALRDYRFGPFLGQILVDKKKVTKEQLDQGLDEQNKLRAQKLGEYLIQESIVTPQELQNALRKQQGRPNIRLGEALINEGYITNAQLADALEKQKQNRTTPLGEILIKMGSVTEIDVRKTLANKLGIPYVNLRKFQIEHDVVALVPEKIARRHNIIPIAKYESKLIIAVKDPLNRAPIEDIRFNTKIFVEPVMALSEDIEWALNLHYGSQINELARELDIETEAGDETTDSEINDSDNTLVKLVNKMIMDAYQQGASDIHIEPGTGKQPTVVRFRKDGSLMPYVELPPTYRNAVVSRIKIMSTLDISERRKPQDGKIDFRKYGPAKIELRVATIPTAGGVEDVVMRVLANNEPIPIDKLSLNSFNLKNIIELVNKPYGLFLVCGPTGSGKTTTLHSILGSINKPDRKIWTAEDPVEITQKGLRQLQVNTKIGLTFANAMRSFLRADPDVIMVGEMRDEDTTRTGIEASLTGHLVMSTLHTNSAPESIVRLLEMGMDPFNFADALLGVLAQRLTKRLCPKCKKGHAATDDELTDLYSEYYSELLYSDQMMLTIEEQRHSVINSWKKRYCNSEGNLILYEPTGCDECNHVGYTGRFAIHELLVASYTIKKLIQERATVADLLLLATQEGMTTLKQDGIEKVLQGLTDLRQVHAVCIK